MVVGIAGKIGAGKNYVAELLEERGWQTLDLDTVAHRALEVHSDKIGKTFGPSVIRDGQVNRSLLGRKVFSNPEFLAELESITYPWIEKNAREWMAQSQNALLAIHAVNLHKTSLVREMNAVIWVAAPLRLRKRRVMARDKRSWRETSKYFRSQKHLGPKIFHGLAETYIVGNKGRNSALNAALDRVLQEIVCGSEPGGSYARRDEKRKNSEFFTDGNAQRSRSAGNSPNGRTSVHAEEERF